MDIVEEPKAEITLDIKAGLSYYLPSLLQLIEGDIRWKSLNKIFNERFKSYSERYEQGERFPLRMTLYSLVSSAENGNQEHIQVLSFIDNVFKSLAKTMTSKEKLLIKTNIANLLEYDHGFLHFLGELCVLNCLLASGICRLEKTEYRLNQNTKGIDFKILNTDTAESFLVEIVNIELRDDKMVNHSLIQKFLSGKFQEKLQDTDKSGILDYTLVPVLWGGKDNLTNILKVKEFYEKTNFKMDRVQIPLVYMQLASDTAIFNKFGSILNCLKAGTLPK